MFIHNGRIDGIPRASRTRGVHPCTASRIEPSCPNVREIYETNSLALGPPASMTLPLIFAFRELIWAGAVHNQLDPQE